MTTPKVPMPAGLTETITIECPKVGTTFGGLIVYTQQLQQIVDQLNQKLLGIKKWYEE